MSATQSQAIRTAFRIPQPEPFRKAAGSPVSTGDSLSAVFMEKTDHEMLNRFGEQILSRGIDISPEELHELRLLDEFLGCHIQRNEIRDVQCMFLWNEWVRAFRRRSRGFPKLILEKEFGKVITDTFGTAIVRDGARGPVYPGIRFLP